MGLSSKVPRRVDLNMLFRLAVAVNHRHMHETVKLWSDTWIENLKRDEGLPGHGIKDSIEASMRSLEDRILGLHLMSSLPKTGKRSKKDKKRQARMDKKVTKQQGES
jgi:hypothetical protein